MEITLTVEELLFAVYFAMPAYTANSIPLAVGGGKPIDFGRCFVDGQRIFGDNKTVVGFFGGLFFGSAVALAEEFVFHPGLALLGFLVSFGVVVGDLLGAFVKRRLKIPPGSPLPVVDQLDFILGAFLFTYPFYRISVGVILLLLVVTPPIHLLANVVAYLLKIKRTFG